LVNNSPVIYDGTGKAAAVSGSVPGSVSSILTGGAATQTNAGTCAVTADFAPTDTANYNSLTGAAAGNFEVFTALTISTQGAHSLTNYLGSTNTVKVVAKDSASNVLGTAELVLTVSGGAFTNIIGVPANTATISLKPRFYLRKKFTVSITGNQVTLDLSGTSFIGGDANSDNKVDGTDYAWLRTLWGRTSNTQYDINGDGHIDAADFPDLNGDGSIGTPDYNILIAGWYKAGDEE